MHESEISESFHTGLRKCCESKEAHHLWHLLHAISNQTLYVFYNIVKDAVKSAEGEIWASVKKSIKDHKPFHNPYTYNEIQALQTACELLSDDDWKGACSYFAEENN